MTIFSLCIGHLLPVLDSFGYIKKKILPFLLESLNYSLGNLLKYMQHEGCVITCKKETLAKAVSKFEHEVISQEADSYH